MKTKRQLSFDGYLKLLQSKGYSHLESGSFGCVYEHPKKNRVIKIFRADKPYLKYITKVFNLKKRNPYFPKVFRIKKYKGKDYDWAMVEMEKLVEIDEIPYAVLETYPYFDDYLAGYSDKYSQDIEDYIYCGKYHEDMELRKACKLIENMVDGINCKLDLFAHNVMFRPEAKGNYRLVFTDPVWKGNHDHSLEEDYW